MFRPYKIKLTLKQLKRYKKIANARNEFLFLQTIFRIAHAILTFTIVISV